MGKINKTDRLILDNNFIPYVDRFIKMDLVYQLIYYFNLYMMKEEEIVRQCRMAWQRGHDFGVVKGIIIASIPLLLVICLLAF